MQASSVSLMVLKGSTYVEVVVQLTGKTGDEMLNTAKRLAT